VLGSGAMSGVLVWNDTPNVSTLWPHSQPSYILRLITFGVSRKEETRVAQCSLRFDEQARLAEVARLTLEEQQYEAKMRVEERNAVSGGVSVRVVFKFDPYSVDPNCWNHCVRCFGTFTNTTSHKLALDLRNVHGLGSGVLQLIVYPVTRLAVDAIVIITTRLGVPRGVRRMIGERVWNSRIRENSIVYKLPPAPKNPASMPLITLEPNGGVYEHRFFLVSPFHTAPKSGRYRLSKWHVHLLLKQFCLSNTIFDQYFVTLNRTHIQPIQGQLLLNLDQNCKEPGSVTSISTLRISQIHILLASGTHSFDVIIIRVFVFRGR
jgi:hypothetical protein